MVRQDDKPNDLLLQILETAEHLRRIAQDSHSNDGAIRGYARSTASLAALLEGWCVDHAFDLKPGLEARLNGVDRSDEVVFLRALRKALSCTPQTGIHGAS